jgi:hypothetical protein
LRYSITSSARASRIGIQEFIDFTKCTQTSAYSTLARACRQRATRRV